MNGCRQRANGTITIDVNQDPITRPMSAGIGRGEVREVPVSDIASDAEALQIVSSTGAPSWVATEAGPARRPTACRHAGRHRVVDDRRARPGRPHRIGADQRDRQQPAAQRRTRLGRRVNAGHAVVASPLDNDGDPDGANDALALQSVPGDDHLPQR